VCHHTVRVLYERNLEYTNKVYVCYIDYEKAFNCVDWTKLMTILQNIGVDWRDRKFIWNLYNKQLMLEFKTVFPLHVLLAEGKARMFTISIVVFNL